ncbi:dUTP diphosphatase [Mycoplasma yeatsii]|uniref:Dimeric dUTPase (All-alpha-NTP-PPase superfamily) n=1 Tax=Mycoplasma yeatsii TaxID=51365 RepID=A0ABU0NFH8_9MOLU|nr:dUTP diphosphatase [Mycoplasma yeatsii]MDQ0567917.1 dimeric dUTPase (all-alpha-NTP-PPase superfamily) [Mycoplasma yeatsii]
MLDNKTLLWLSEKQTKLDSYISNKKQFIVDDEILNKKIIAFLVELGEYANEERVFKYWSNKKEAELSVQLDEYIDCTHFLISIGNQMNYDFNKFEYQNLMFKNNIDAYFNIVNKLANFINNKNHTTYADLLNSFLNICSVKNYSQKEIIDAYNIKNEINFKRQDNNY